MKLLLDTHVFLWALENEDRLSANARDAIADANNIIFVSAVSAWEIAIKRGLGKIELDVDLDEAVDELGFLRADLRFSTARLLSTLPALHRDPFDRMLIAQSIEDGIPLVTDDDVIRRYPLQTYW